MIAIGVFDEQADAYASILTEPEAFTDAPDAFIAALAMRLCRAGGDPQQAFWRVLPL